MCVIIAAETARPTNDELIQADLTNQDGLGVAYIAPKDELVTWHKGLSVEETEALVSSITPPFVVHARIATSGGVKKALCHPFPITRNVGITTNGRAREVLFHNGIWGAYEKFKGKAKLTGPVSDTRIMAYLLWREGKDNRDGVVKQITEGHANKLAVLSTTGLTRYGEWIAGTKEDPDTTEGCFYSNLSHCWTGCGVGYDWITDDYFERHYRKTKGADYAQRYPVTHYHVNGQTWQLTETPQALSTSAVTDIQEEMYEDLIEYEEEEFVCANCDTALPISDRADFRVGYEEVCLTCAPCFINPPQRTLFVD